jgi:DNA-binding HxlR family transcriptional regulator
VNNQPDNKSYQCGVALTLEVIGGKWKGIILWHLLHKTLRFSQLQRRISKITQKMLTQQLRELERDGMVYRQIFAEVPPRVEYSLTPKGESLRELLSFMCEWGQENVERQEENEAVLCKESLNRT